MSLTVYRPRMVSAPSQRCANESRAMTPPGQRQRHGEQQSSAPPADGLGGDHQDGQRRRRPAAPPGRSPGTSRVSGRRAGRRPATSVRMSSAPGDSASTRPAGSGTSCSRVPPGATSRPRERGQPHLAPARDRPGRGGQQRPERQRDLDRGQGAADQQRRQQDHREHAVLGESPGAAGPGLWTRAGRGRRLRRSRAADYTWSTDDWTPRYWAHPTAIIEQPAASAQGTRIWHFSHVMPGARIGARCSLGQNSFVGARR